MNNAKIILSLFLALLGALWIPASASAAMISAAPAIPWPGASVRLELSGFQPHARGVASLTGARLVRFRVDTRGRATAVVTLPGSARRGQRSLRVQAGGRTVVTVLTVARARRALARLVALSGGQRVLLDPASGRAGDRFTLRATGFSRRTALAVRFGDQTVAGHKPDAAGRFMIVGSVPAIAPGTRQVRVASGRTSVSLPFRVLAAPFPPMPVAPIGSIPPPPPSPPPPAAGSPPGPAATPAVSITGPVNGATLKGSVAVTATASDAGGVTGVQFRLDGADLGAEDTTAPYATTWSTTTAGDGGHVLTAVARGAGASTATSAAVSVTVDNSPPAVAVTAPAAGPIPGRSTVTVQASASDNIGVSSVQFRLDGNPLGPEDATAPFSTTWNTKTARNGAHTLTAVARDAVSFTESAAVTVTVDNTPPAGSRLIAAAGDIACSPNDPDFNGGLGWEGACRQRATSDLLVGRGYSDVLTLGDTQYDCNTAADFAGSFDPTWGRVKDIIHPAIGNHEYKSTNPDLYGASGCSPGAAGYFGYFGASAGDPRKGYYSFDIGAWRVFALNTNRASADACPDVSCAAGSEQEQWLRDELARNTSRCTLAFWHHPLFTSKAPSRASKPFWDALYAAGADIVLSGHVHNYERFNPQTPNGTADPARGIAQFVVGTGGKNFESSGAPIANSAAAMSGFGVLELMLSPTSYEWQFVTTGGQSFDAGSADCR